MGACLRQTGLAHALYRGACGGGLGQAGQTAMVTRQRRSATPATGVLARYRPMAAAAGPPRRTRRTRQRTCSPRPVRGAAARSPCSAGARPSARRLDRPVARRTTSAAVVVDVSIILMPLVGPSKTSPHQHRLYAKTPFLSTPTLPRITLAIHHLQSHMGYFSDIWIMSALAIFASRSGPGAASKRSVQQAARPPSKMVFAISSMLMPAFFSSRSTSASTPTRL